MTRGSSAGLGLYELFPFRAKLEKLLRLFVKPLALVPVECRAADDSEDNPRTEVVAVIEMLYRLDDFFAGQPRVVNGWKLVTHLVRHIFDLGEEVVLLEIIVKLGAGIGMRD